VSAPVETRRPGCPEDMCLSGVNNFSAGVGGAVTVGFDRCEGVSSFGVKLSFPSDDLTVFDFVVVSDPAPFLVAL